ncbi:hypothetical protein HRbin04_01351 [archaeon HR04]|nr:hypothetical protein HRbin04_01351 [archaeon HR04]
MQAITNTTTPIDELEESILLFFVKSKSRSIKLETILDTFRRYQSHIVMKAIVKLCEEGYFVVLKDTTVMVNNYPLFIQHFMQFKRIDTAYLLYFIIMQNIQNIRAKRDAVFNYKMFLIPKFTEDFDIVKTILLFYKKEDYRFYNAIYELRKNGLLIKKKRMYYDFIYSKIDPTLLEFLIL